MASNLLAMVSTLVAMASNLASDRRPSYWTMKGWSSCEDVDFVRRASSFLQRFFVCRFFGAFGTVLALHWCSIWVTFSRIMLGHTDERLLRNLESRFQAKFPSSSLFQCGELE